MKKGIFIALLTGSASVLFAQTTKPATGKTAAKQVAPMANAQLSVEQPVAKPVDPIVMVVGKEEIPLSEFEAIFLKNHPKDKAVTRAELDEYAGLFVNFKLKVQAAKDAGVDTTAAFRSEFAGYKKQLAQPYLKDKQAEERMLDEIMQRMRTDLNVSHILVKAKSDCMSPADTAELYKKSMDIRKRLLKGEDFAKVANEVSEDTYSNKNGGSLGWFTGLMWAYPFESAAFSLKKGEISLPVKTSMGYHIIKLNDSRAARGDVKAAHIFVAPSTQTPDDKAKALAKINEAYAALQSGTAWMEVVSKYSDDKTTAASGGELPAFGIGKMVQEFEDAAYSLKNEGDYSAPIETKYGYHIVKLLTKIDKTPTDKNKEEFRKQLQKNPRFKLVSESFTEKTKKELGFTLNTKLIDKIKAMEAASKNKTIRISSIDSLPNEELFKLGNSAFKLSDFTAFLKSRAPRGGDLNFCNLELKYLNPFIESKAIEQADANLETKYPEYKALLKEYREGIMIFEMMDKKVWSKSVDDTVGLKAYYETNKNNYMWKERVQAYRIIAGDSATLVKVKKEAEKVVAGKKTLDDLKAKFNKKEAVVAANEEIKEPGESKELDALGKTAQAGPIAKSKENWYFYLVKGTRAPEPKDLKSAKGLVISDYQTYLETEWLRELKTRYRVVLNKEVMYKLAK